MRATVGIGNAPAFSGQNLPRAGRRAQCEVLRHGDFFGFPQRQPFDLLLAAPHALEPREALEFSFELAPRYCFMMNGRRLPFGCHAWFRYDREFWEPFLLG